MGHRDNKELQQGRMVQKVSRWAGVGTLLKPFAGNVPGGQGLPREKGSQQWKHIGVRVECDLYIFRKEHCDVVLIASEINDLMICMSFLRYARYDVSSVGCVEK